EVAGEAFAVDPDEHALAPDDVAGDERQVFEPAAFEGQAPELAVVGRKARLPDAAQQRPAVLDDQRSGRLGEAHGADSDPPPAAEPMEEIAKEVGDRCDP